MQKDLIRVINCLLCCINSYSWGVIHSSYRICIRSHCIRRVVKFYNHMLRLHVDAIFFSVSASRMKRLLFMTVFIRTAPVEDNSALECIRSVAATYGCKFYNHTNAMRTCTDVPTQVGTLTQVVTSVHLGRPTLTPIFLLTYLIPFSTQLRTQCFKIRLGMIGLLGAINKIPD